MTRDAVVSRSVRPAVRPARPRLSGAVSLPRRDHQQSPGADRRRPRHVSLPGPPHAGDPARHAVGRRVPSTLPPARPAAPVHEGAVLRALECHTARRSRPRPRPAAGRPRHRGADQSPRDTHAHRGRGPCPAACVSAVSHGHPARDRDPAPGAQGASVTMTRARCSARGSTCAPHVRGLVCLPEAIRSCGARSWLPRGHQRLGPATENARTGASRRSRQSATSISTLAGGRSNSK